MKMVKSGITSVKGIKVLGKNVGIAESGKKDLGIIFSEKVSNAAAVFTKNSAPAAHIMVDKEKIKSGRVQAIVVNSGAANASTGIRGINDAKKICKLIAGELKINDRNVLIASTGKIGTFLPMKKIANGIKGVSSQLSSSKKANEDFIEAIMTTDTTKKQITVRVKGVTIAGVCKGSGMIRPNMGTMLCFIATDAIVSSKLLKQALKQAVEDSFNMISVDDDMSTNDTVVLFANGMSKKEIAKNEFQEALNFVCKSLARMIAKDGEGATKLIEVNVSKAKNKEHARKFALAVVGSNLVKTAVHGCDPNWGRIIASLGSTQLPFNQQKVDIYFGKEKVVSKGVALKFDEKKVRNILSREEVSIDIFLNDGSAHATAYGCDLTSEYVKINAEYST